MSPDCICCVIVRLNSFRDFEAALKAIHWPFLSTRTTAIDNKAVVSGDTEAENLDNFKKHFRRLLLLKLPYP